jgi:hypothetical protein
MKIFRGHFGILTTERGYKPQARDGIGLVLRTLIVYIKNDIRRW